MSTNKFNQFQNMSISELKDEYYKCDDITNSVKKQILKKLIKLKMSNEKEEKKLLEKRIEQQKKADEELNKKMDNIIKMRELAERDKKIKLDPIIKKRGNMEQYWESNQVTQKIDPRLKNEIETDHSNNKLMERLNCELDFRINEERSKNVIKPFSTQDSGNFKEFEKYSVPPNDFSNRRLNKKN